MRPAFVGSLALVSHGISSEPEKLFYERWVASITHIVLAAAPPVTTEVALHAEAPFAGLAVLSGTLLAATRWAAAARARGPAIHALMTHGRNDPLLPMMIAEMLRELLERAGASVEWVPHGGQHEIPSVALDRLGAFARRRLAIG